MKVKITDKGNFTTIHDAANHIANLLKDTCDSYQVIYAHPSRGGFVNISKTQPTFNKNKAAE